MKNIIFLAAALMSAGAWAAPSDVMPDTAVVDAPFHVVDSLYDYSDVATLGLDYPRGIETVTVFESSDSTDHFCNGVVMASFKGALYCMWQSSAVHEDSPDTWVAYSRSDDDGATWSAPMVLASAREDGISTSGGWHVTADTIIGYINFWPKGMEPKGGYAYFRASADGMNWSDLRPVTMADGSQMNGIFEQDPHRMADGRIVGAAHFQPGLKICPIYTDDPLGVSGWHRGDFSHSGSGRNSREMEPSLYRKSDGTVVMIFRDQKNTYYKMASESHDNGVTWSGTVLTNMRDARTKQSAGNLPDGTAYMVGNPVEGKFRIPLTVTLSSDGICFDRAYLLRGGGDALPPMRDKGSAKRPGYHYPKSMVADGYLYVGYALNKEDVQYTRIPLSSLE